MRISARDLAKEIDPLMNQLRGLVRRFAITLTSKALWQLTGFRNPDGTIETRQVEPFTGIGFFARPPSSGSPEAIVGMLGEASSPVIIAVRDEKTRAASAGDLQQDEAAVFNTSARVHVKAGGIVAIELVNTPAVDAMVKGTTYRAAEDTLFNVISDAATAVSVYAEAIEAIAEPTGGGSIPPYPITTALVLAMTNLTAALTTFAGGAATYLSTVGKVG